MVAQPHHPSSSGQTNSHSRTDATARLMVRRVRLGQSPSVLEERDVVVTEEPMEVRVIPTAADGAEADSISVAVTMRTPGHDFELAAGFLYTEGILPAQDAVARIAYCTDPGVEQEHNIVNVTLQPWAPFDETMLTRNFYMTSSCGVCGKASLDAIHVRGCPALPPGGITVDARLIPTLPERLRGGQRLFDRTGGLHAAGLFTADGRLTALREDVGRHNAVDKLIGARLLEGAVPLSDSVLVLSGRASFELMQKALVAGIPVVVAVGAPSSLAVDLARDFNMTLIGFVRGGTFNVYAGAERIAP